MNKLVWSLYSKLVKISGIRPRSLKRVGFSDSTNQSMCNLSPSSEWTARFGNNPTIGN